MSGTHRWTIVAALAAGMLIGAVSVATPVVSQEAEPARGQANMDEEIDFRFKKPTPEESEEAMKRWMDTVKLGKYHRYLEKFIGEWETTMTVKWSPDAAPTVSKGKASYSWAFEKRWLLYRDENTFMDAPMNTLGFLGYDNFKKKFVGTHISTQTTALVAYEGVLDRTGTELMMWGPMDEPMTGEHDKVVRYHWKFDGKDKFVIEVHDLFISGDDTKVFDILFVRKKAE